MRAFAIIAIISLLTLPAYVSADVAEDIQRNQPTSVVVANAADLTYSELFTSAYAANPLQVPNIVAVTVTNIPDDTPTIVESAIQVAPELLDEIITAAIQAAPTLAPIIVSIAVQYGADPDAIAALAIAASPEVDPTAVTEATAAGIVIPPNTTGTVPTPAALAGNGGGGGNTASPN
ncbi:hypothetical protein Q8W30_05595 [Neptunomonas phycophila]|uniref:Uncharacterized protein n=1 Tax=Neptunomonas phycophila TaxID=1572645 RepID=A0ABT9ESJ9_9GAMM|nr:hypothetical protein [Neptunomonas phycophila]MDP2522041.1 hypothetical protein [Neptunomonas phycophila]